MPGIPDLFHISQNRFERPSRVAGVGALLRDGEHHGKHPKGALGLWLSPSPGSCEGLGTHAAHPEFCDGTVFAAMEISHLRKIADDVEELSFADQVQSMSALGVALSKHCDVLLIADATEQVGEVIVLNEDCLATWNWTYFSAAVEQSKHEDRSWESALADIDVEASRAVAGWRLDASGKPLQQKQQGLRP